MERMIASCGLICSECPAFLATQADDDSQRREVAEKWSAEFKADLKPEDIDCLGCLSDSEPLFKHCTVCEIRACSGDKGVVNCGHCDQYVCDRLGTFFEMVPAAKATLDEVRKNL